MRVVVFWRGGCVRAFFGSEWFTLRPPPPANRISKGKSHHALAKVYYSLGQREVVHLLPRMHDGASDATQESAASAMVPHKAPPAPQTKASGDDWPDFQAFLAGTPPKKMEQKHYADAAEERAVAALQAPAAPS